MLGKKEALTLLVNSFCRFMMVEPHYACRLFLLAEFDLYVFRSFDGVDVESDIVFYKLQRWDVEGRDSP